ncbi:MAG: hypothetical protein WA584_14070 [Pyrinomonadaceae bacterium]
MTKNKLKALIISAFLIIAVCCTQMQQSRNNSNTTNVNNVQKTADVCSASADWLTSPSLPGEIVDNQTTCPFHQFSWQTFLAFMNQTGTSDRAFQDEKNFPLLLADGKNSCVDNNLQSRLFIRTGKDNDGPDDDFILPERITQAAKSNPAIIYDINGNVVLYEVRFSRDECSLDPKTALMFPPGTTEIKVSYRAIKETDKSNYVWINADINGDGKIDPDELLGMVGFHLVKSTPNHPEFIWASFEHIQNAPECEKPAAAPAAGWSFTSATCAAELPNSVDSKTCDFNLAAPSPSPTPTLKGGPPTQVCKVYHDGSKTGDTAFGDNVAAIDALNNQLTGPNGLIAKTLSASNPLAVLQNYQLIGTLWLIDPNQSSQLPGKPTTDTTNQVGSIQLANSTMETSFQQFTVASNGDAMPVGYTGSKDLQPAANCFFCHRYDAGDPKANPPTPRNNVQISHIYPKGIFGTTN